MRVCFLLSDMLDMKFLLLITSFFSMTLWASTGKIVQINHAGKMAIGRLLDNFTKNAPLKGEYVSTSFSDGRQCSLKILKRKNYFVTLDSSQCYRQKIPLKVGQIFQLESVLDIKENTSFQGEERFITSFLEKNFNWIEKRIIGTSFLLFYDPNTELQSRNNQNDYTTFKKGPGFGFGVEYRKKFFPLFYTSLGWTYEFTTHISEKNVYSSQNPPKKIYYSYPLPAIRLMGIYFKGELLISRDLSVFIGPNFSIPSFVMLEGKPKGLWGYKLGISYRILQEISADFFYKKINMAIDNNLLSSSGFVFQARYTF